jgi:hypothetical protein
MNAFLTSPTAPGEIRFIRDGKNVRPTAAALMPAIRSVIDRRMLINFRVDPDAVRPLLPAPLGPKLVRGFAVAGICLLRLRDTRPAGLPAWLGIGSENMAHRIEVEWTETSGALCEGVFIPRRDTASRLNVALGGRLFPGAHHAARFRVIETEESFKIAVESDDGEASLRVRARRSSEWPGDSLFASLAEASDFFARGSLGWSPQIHGGGCEGIELRSSDWRMEALAADRVESKFFDDRRRFPTGSIQLDSVLLMRGIPCEWHARGNWDGTIRTRGACETDEAARRGVA